MDGWRRAPHRPPARNWHQCPTAAQFCAMIRACRAIARAASPDRQSPRPDQTAAATRANGGAQPLHPPAFLIDQNGRITADRRPQIPRQPAQLFRRFHIAGKEDKAERIGIAEKRALIGQQLWPGTAEDGRPAPTSGPAVICGQPECSWRFRPPGPSRSGARHLHPQTPARAGGRRCARRFPPPESPSPCPPSDRQSDPPDVAILARLRLRVKAPNCTRRVPAASVAASTSTGVATADGGGSGRRHRAPRSGRAIGRGERVIAPSGAGKPAASNSGQFDASSARSIAAPIASDKAAAKGRIRCRLTSPAPDRPI